MSDRGLPTGQTGKTITLEVEPSGGNGPQSIVVKVNKTTKLKVTRDYNALSLEPDRPVCGREPGRPAGERPQERHVGRGARQAGRQDHHPGGGALGHQRQGKQSNKATK